jgi:hypothetical protein
VAIECHVGRMLNLKTICAVSMISAAAFVLAGCPEEGADREKTAEEAKAKGTEKKDDTKEAKDSKKEEKK